MSVKFNMKTTIIKKSNRTVMMCSSICEFLTNSAHKILSSHDNSSFMQYLTAICKLSNTFAYYYISLKQKGLILLVDLLLLLQSVPFSHLTLQNRNLDSSSTCDIELPLTYMSKSKVISLIAHIKILDIGFQLILFLN